MTIELDYLKFVMQKVDTVEKCIPEEKSGFILGQKMHTCATAIKDTFNTCAPIAKKHSINLSTKMWNGSKVVAAKISEQAQEIFNELKETPKGEALAKKIASLHLTEKYQKVKATTQKAYYKVKTASLSFYSKTLKPITLKALAFINKHKGPTFAALKAKSLKVAVFMNTHVVKPSLTVIKKLAKKIAAKCKPVLSPLKSKVILPLKTKVEIARIRMLYFIGGLLAGFKHPVKS